MANLQIKGMDDDIYAHLKALAASEHRSVSQQVLFLVRAYLARTNHLDPTKTPAEVLLDLAGSWEDPKGSGRVLGNSWKDSDVPPRHRHHHLQSEGDGEIKVL